MKRDRFFVSLAASQGTYYVVTGLWPLVSMRSFEAVSGPKVDDWLVNTVGGLVTVIGSVVFLAGLRRSSAPEVPLLAAGSAAALAGIDIYYVARGRISRVYLADA